MRQLIITVKYIDDTTQEVVVTCDRFYLDKLLKVFESSLQVSLYRIAGSLGVEKPFNDSYTKWIIEFPNNYLKD